MHVLVRSLLFTSVLLQVSCGGSNPPSVSLTINNHVGAFVWAKVSIPGTNNRAPGGAAGEVVVRAFITATPGIASVQPNTDGGNQGATWWYVYLPAGANGTTYTMSRGKGATWVVKDWGQSNNAVGDAPGIRMGGGLDLTIDGPSSIVARNAENSGTTVFDLRVVQSDIDIPPSALSWRSSQFQALPWVPLITTQTWFAPGGMQSLVIPSTTIDKRYLYVREDYCDSNNIRMDGVMQFDLRDVGSRGDLFEVYPERAGASSSAATRMSLDVNAGELLYHVPPDAFVGVGGSGASCAFQTFRFVTQDQDQSTAETCNVVFRAADANGAPDLTPTGLLYRSGDITLWGTGIGPSASIVTHTFLMPLEVPCRSGFFYGIEVRAAPGWPNDGQSCHAALRAPLATTVGDIPRAGAKVNAWYVLNGVGGPSTSGLSLRVGGNVPGAILNLACNDPGNALTPRISFGEGGMYPDVKSGGRDDGIQARVLHTANIGGSASLFVSIGGATPGLALPGFQGSLLLNPASVLHLVTVPIVATGAPAVGIANLPILAPGAVPAVVRGFLVDFQALSMDASFGNPTFSNLQRVSF